MHYQPCTGLLWVNGCLDRHRRLSRTPVEKLQLLETLKNKLGHAGGRGYRFRQSPKLIHAQTTEISTDQKVRTDGFSALYSRLGIYLLTFNGNTLNQLTPPKHLAALNLQYVRAPSLCRQYGKFEWLSNYEYQAPSFNVESITWSSSKSVWLVF